jgi:HK97 family phage major capsid protein
MKTSIILKEERSDIISQLENIKDVSTTEERDLTSDENNQVDGLLTEIDNLDAKIERAEKMETIKRNAAVVSGVTATKKDKDLEKFTFQGAVRAAYSGDLSGIYKEMDQEARSKARYTGQNYRGVAIPSSVLTRTQDYVDTANQNSVRTMSFTDQLQSNLVLASAGANTYFGVENMKLPVISGITSAWQPETGGTEADGEGTTTNVTLTPTKLISIVNVSQESMIQNASLEGALQRNMAASIASYLETALLDTANVTHAPTSIFNGVGSSASTAAFSGASASALDNAYIANKGTYEGARMAYLMDADAYGDIKTSDLVSGVSAAYDMRDKTVNGMFSFVSSNVAAQGASGKGHVLYGDFSKVHIAQFGGLDLLFDPYTYGGIGIPRLIVTSLVDGAAVQNTTAFTRLIEA